MESQVSATFSIRSLLAVEVTCGIFLLSFSLSTSPAHLFRAAVFGHRNLKGNTL